MSRLILHWTPEALADVQRLYRFLAHKNPDAARGAARAIRIGVKILAHQPHLGRPIVDLEAEYREWLIDFGNDGYITLYHFDGLTTTILAVRHQKEAGYGDNLRSPD